MKEQREVEADVRAKLRGQRGHRSAALAFLRLRAHGVGMDGGGTGGGEDFAGDALRICGGFHEQLSPLGTRCSAMLNALAFHLRPVRAIASAGAAGSKAATRGSV